MQGSMKYDNYSDSDELAKRIFLDRLSECELFPKYIMIEPIYACNSRCVMCGFYNGNVSMPEGMGAKMESWLFDKIMHEIRPYADWIEMVTLYGRCEPLLDVGLEDKVKVLHEMGIKQIQVSTNGSLLTKERARRLFLAGLNDLRLSIDSIKEEVYESIRRGLCFQTVIDNAENAIAIRNEIAPDASIRIRAVAMDVNQTEREEWTSFWNNRISVRGGDKAEFMIYSARTAYNENTDDERTSPCISPFSTIIIRYNGEVHLCCEDGMGEMVLGNIKDDSLQSVWQSEKMRRIRKLQLAHQWNRIPPCRHCILWELPD